LPGHLRNPYAPESFILQLRQFRYEVIDQRPARVLTRESNSRLIRIEILSSRRAGPLSSQWPNAEARSADFTDQLHRG
jgi:hypothetical protein